MTEPMSEAMDFATHTVERNLLLALIATHPDPDRLTAAFEHYMAQSFADLPDGPRHGLLKMRMEMTDKFLRARRAQVSSTPPTPPG